MFPNKQATILGTARPTTGMIMRGELTAMIACSHKFDDSMMKNGSGNKC